MTFTSAALANWNKLSRSALSGNWRLKGIFDNDAASEWFNSGVKGLPYGWSDILANGLPNTLGSSSTDIAKSGGVDCSHFAAALLEVAGLPQFDELFPKNKITPRDFKLSSQSINLPIG